MKPGRLAGLVLVVVLVSAALYWARAGRSTDNSGSGQTPRGGRLVASYSSEPKSFNRLVSPIGADEVVSRLTQTTLIRVNRITGEVEPRLAREWSSSADGLTWTFKLRDGVTFSDGAPFTSADVVFTFAALYDKRVASWMASTVSVNNKPLVAQAIDPATVQITFPSVFGPGITLLDTLPILPKHKLQAALDAGTFRDAWSVTTPPSEIAGLGPFVLTSYAPGQRLLFARNKRFWKRDPLDETLPYVDEIQIDIIPDTSAEVLRLESGGADLMSHPVRPEDLAAFRRQEKNGAIRLAEAGVSIDPNVMWFNLVPGAAATKDRPWLRQEALRHAISFAVNRQAIVDTVYLGAAVPIFGPVTPGYGEWYLPDLPRTNHDPAHARSLLTSIGLRDANKRRHARGRRRQAGAVFAAHAEGQQRSRAHRGDRQRTSADRRSDGRRHRRGSGDALRPLPESRVRRDSLLRARRLDRSGAHAGVLDELGTVSLLEPQSAEAGHQLGSDDR